MPDRPGNDDQRDDVRLLQTGLGELRLNLTSVQVQLADILARLVKMEAADVTRATALQQFSFHVQTCERQNTDAVAARLSFRREMRGYSMTVLLLLLGALGYILYHGFPWK